MEIQQPRVQCVDSGALRMMGQHSRSPDEQTSMRAKDKRTTIQTANGVVEAALKEHFSDEEVSRFVKLVDDAPPVLSSGGVMRRNG